MAPTRAPRPGSMVKPRPASVGAVTDPKLPPPRGAGVAGVRRTEPIPSKGTPAPRGQAVAPRAGGDKAPGSVNPGRMPISEVKDGSDPNAPTTSAPPERFKEKIADRHARLFKRPDDVGGTAPWQGRVIRPGGGIPKHPAPVLHNVPVPDPKEQAAGNGSSPRGLRQAIGKARRDLKRPVILRPGIGGLDIAQGPRLKPNTPSGVKEAIRDVRSRKWHGTLAGHYTAPKSVVTAAVAAKVAAPIPETISIAAASQKETESIAKAPTLVPSNVVAAVETDGKLPQTAAPASSGSMPGWAVPVIAAVALFAISRG